MDHQNFIWLQDFSESENLYIIIPQIACSSSTDQGSQIDQLEIISPHKIYSCKYCYLNFKSSLKLEKHYQASDSRCLESNFHSLSD